MKTSIKKVEKILVIDNKIKTITKQLTKLKKDKEQIVNVFTKIPKTFYHSATYEIPEVSLTINADFIRQELKEEDQILIISLKSIELIKVSRNDIFIYNKGSGLAIEHKNKEFLKEVYEFIYKVWQYSIKNN